MPELTKMEQKWVRAAIDKAEIDRMAEDTAFKLYCERAGKDLNAESVNAYLLQRMLSKQ